MSTNSASSFDESFYHRASRTLTSRRFHAFDYANSFVAISLGLACWDEELVALFGRWPMNVGVSSWLALIVLRVMLLLPGLGFLWGTSAKRRLAHKYGLLYFSWAWMMLGFGAVVGQNPFHPRLGFPLALIGLGIASSLGYISATAEQPFVHKR